MTSKRFLVIVETFFVFVATLGLLGVSCDLINAPDNVAVVGGFFLTLLTGVFVRVSLHAIWRKNEIC